MWTGDQNGRLIPQELELILWPMIINGFDICSMLNVCACCPVITNGFGICYMLNVCVCMASDH